jgi:hypothetical protein
MIDRNLGNLERVIRLLFAVVFSLWALTRPEMSLAEWAVLLLALFFFLNGLFSRCYLWYILDINTYRDTQTDSDSAAC